MRVKAEVKITVWYDDAEDPDTVADFLRDQVSRAVGNGLLSHDDMTVDTWKKDVVSYIVKS